MASLGSSSVLLQNGRGSWHRRSGGGSAFYASCRANGIDRNVGLWASRKTAEGGTLSGVSSSRVGEMGKCVQAVGKRGRRQAQVRGGDDDGEGVVEEVIKATIEKSKKVVAVQDDLRKQMAERRKLVSSIKASMVDSSKDVVSSSKSGESLSEDSIGLTSGKFYGEDSGSTYSDSYSESYTTKTSKTATLGSNGDSINETKELLDGSQVESLLSREIDSMATDSTTLPSLLPISTEPYATEDEKAEEFAAEAYEGILVEQVADSEEGNASTEPYATEDEKAEEFAAEAYEGILVEQVADSEEGNVVSPLAGPNVMNVILVAAECAPWSKTGGLGDVAGALPKALARRGHRVMVVVPLYGNYAEPEEVGVRKIYNVDGQDMEVTYYHAYIDGVDFIFLGSAIFRGRQNDIYGGQRMDILKRMVLLCKAAVEVPWLIPCGGACYGDGNLVFIANDWHTALLPVYLKAYYRDNGLMKYTRSVLVIHNIAHQGRGPLDDFKFLNLPPHCLDLFKLYDPVGGEHLNIFAGGLKTADRVVAVSQGYAWELKTEEGGWGLHNIITENDWKLHGIVNRIDTEDWNPELDVHLKSDGYTNYSLETLQTGKPQCKAALQREVHLPVRDVPLFGFIGRLDGQKGVDIIAEAIPWLVSQDAQLILLGTGRSDLEEMLRKLEGLYHDKVIGRVGFSVSLAHRITAGADALLMPSRFEPCGLNQLYAMRYGTIPVVHAVGGLRDTVKPFDPFTESGLGWTFNRAEANGMIDATRNCLNTYWNYKSSWEGLQRRGMAQDLSWDSVAEHYEEILVAAKYQW